MIEERPLSASRSSSIETLDTPVSVFGLSLLSRNQNQGAELFSSKHALFQSQSPLRLLSVLLKTAGCGRVSSRSGIRPKYSAGLGKTPETSTVNGLCPLLEEREMLLQTVSCLFQLVQFVKCWQIFLELNSKKTVSKFRKRKRVAVLCSRPRQNVKLGTFTSVQQRQRTVLKRVMHAQSCCFANVNL